MIAAVTREMDLQGRDFLDIADLAPAELRSVLQLAHAIKARRWAERPLLGKHVAMLFQKPSQTATSTRSSPACAATPT